LAAIARGIGEQHPYTPILLGGSAADDKLIGGLRPERRRHDPPASGLTVKISGGGYEF